MLIVPQQSGALIWDQGRPPRKRALPKKRPVRFVQFLGNGERFAAMLSNPSSILQGRIDSNKKGTLLPLPFEVNRGVFSRDGHLLAFRKKKNAVAVWDVELKEQRHLLRHDASVFSLAISPNGRFVATGASDNVVRLFNMVNGEIVARVKGHGKGKIFLTSAVYSLAFAPNGKYMASGGHDGRVIVWDIDSAKVIFRSKIASDPIVWSVAFSPDSQLVAGGSEAAGAKQSLCVWELPPPAEPRQE
ncbi:MAG: WD40 repeat domain-containing protein [Planctomycetaceae bacterium]